MSMRGLLAVAAGFAGGAAKGALDYDQALKKTAAQERRDRAMHLRAMAMAKYKQKGAESLADINNQAASEQIDQRGAIQKEVTSMSNESRENVAAANRESSENISAARIKAQREIARAKDAAAMYRLEKGQEFQQESQGSGMYKFGRELTKKEYNALSAREKGQLRKEGKLLTTEQFNQKAAEAERELERFKNELAIKQANAENKADAVKDAKEKAKEAALDTKTDVALGRYYPKFPDLSTKKKQEVLEAYFLGLPFEHIILESASKSDEGGNKKDNKSALNNPKVFSNLVAQDMQETAAEKGKGVITSRPTSQLNADPQVQPPSVDDDGTVMYDMPPRY